MLRNLRVGWRQLVADPGYSAAILLGLSVAIACCCLVAQIVFNEVLPDPDVPDPVQVVRLEYRGNNPGAHEDWFDQAPFVFATTLRQAGAPVSAISRTVENDFDVRAGDRVANLGVVLADAQLVDVYGLRAVAGDLRDALRRPDTIALTVEAARKLFPAGDAVGKSVRVHGHTLTVDALLARRSGAAMDHADGLASFDSSLNTLPAEERTQWYSMSGAVVARVAGGHSADEVGKAAQALLDHGPAVHEAPPEWTANGRQAAFLRATPLTRQYLEGARGHSHRMLLLGLGAGAVLMLGLALANYVNLTSVRTLARAREIAVRKTLGAGPWRLMAQFAFESVLAAMLASAVGLLLAWWVAPAIGDLLTLRLADGLLSPSRVLILVAAAIALGACTGAYPARLALGVRPVDALAGRSHDEGAKGRGLRRALTALQFAVALVIASGASVVLWQNAHVAALAHGVRTQGLLTLDMPGGFFNNSKATNAAFRAALSHEPGVEAMAWSMDVPGRNADRMSTSATRSRGEPLVTMGMVPVDKDFFDVYGVTILAGAPRLPDLPAPSVSASAAAGAKTESLAVIDAEASRALGFASPQAAVGSLILIGGDVTTLNPLRVVAVAATVRLESARDRVIPHLFTLGRNPQITLTLQGPRMDLLQQAVARVWPRFYPDDTAYPVTVEEALAQPYEFEHRIAQMAAATTALALLLSAFGVYALAAYTVRRSAREIVIRKLYGAGRARIARLMLREFAPLLGAAALVGLPLAGWLAQAWLANFTERSPTAFFALPLALVALAAMTTLAALRHARIAMAMRPTAALRD